MTIRCWMLVAATVATAWGGVRGPDPAGYAITDDGSFSFTDISGTGVRILAGSDDAAAVVSLGFSFRFYGNAYSSVCVSTNGVISFSGCNADFVNQDLTADAPEGDLPTIAAYWDDLTFAASGADAVYYQTLGTAGNRRFVVQWNNAFSTNGTRAITFQAVLDEQSGRVRLLYRQLEAGAGLAENQGGRATVGIRDRSGHLSGRRVQWSFRAPVLPNGSALLASSTAPSLTGLFNAASFLASSIAPNTIMTLFGVNLACPSGMRVLLNGKNTEVLYAGEAQLNFVIPGDVIAQNPAVVSAECDGMTAGQVSVEAAGAAPALFTASGGKGQASILNQDYGLNGASTPAPRGSVVMVYGTGFGRAKAPGAGGLSWLEAGVSAIVGGVPAEVTYAGLAPGMTAGLQQINIRIPPDSPVGAAVPITIVADGRSTQPDTTVAVR